MSNTVLLVQLQPPELDFLSKLKECVMSDWIDEFEDIQPESKRRDDRHRAGKSIEEDPDTDDNEFCDFDRNREPTETERMAEGFRMLGYHGDFGSDD